MEYIDDFLFLYITKSLGAPQKLCGLAIFVGVSFELPFFHFSDHLLNKLGVHGMILVAHCVYIIRALAYTLLTKETVWCILLIEPCHGIIFSLFWSASVHHAANIAPVGREATCIGLLSGIYSGLGHAMGGITGGYIFHRLGPITLYRTSAFFICCSFALYFYCFYFVFVETSNMNSKKKDFLPISQNEEEDKAPPESDSSGPIELIELNRISLRSVPSPRRRPSLSSNSSSSLEESSVSVSSSAISPSKHAITIGTVPGNKSPTRVTETEIMNEAEMEKRLNQYKKKKQAEGKKKVEQEENEQWLLSGDRR